MQETQEETVSNLLNNLMAEYGFRRIVRGQTAESNDHPCTKVAEEEFGKQNDGSRIILY